MESLVLTALFALVFANHEDYIGWKSYFVAPSTADQVKSLHSLTNKLQLDFLSPAIVGRKGVVLVKPRYKVKFIENLKNLSINYTIHAKDVKLELDYDDETIEDWMKQSDASQSGKSMFFEGYQRLDRIYAEMDQISSRYQDIATVVTAGNSFEGRPVKYMKISTSKFEDEKKPIIFIDAGIHAREWIAPPTVIWAISKLTENVTEPDLLNNFDWILMPVVNPDGYEYTFTNERFWRMTRSNDTNVFSDACPGVDGNRNYDFFWNTVGTSLNPCRESYAGNRAFSELETRAVDSLLKEHLSRIILYISMHSYGSMILYPWGHNQTDSKNGRNLHAVAVAMADAIHSKALASFPRYTVGNSAGVMNYPASGASDDYTHSIGIPLAYTFELPGLLPGMKGFALHPRYIEQICRETWAGIQVGATIAGHMYNKTVGTKSFYYL